MKTTIITLSKKRSRNRVEISPNLDMSKDGWFQSIRYIEIKSGKITRTYTITEKDVAGWLRYFKSNGWTINENA